MSLYRICNVISLNYKWKILENIYYNHQNINHSPPPIFGLCDCIVERKKDSDEIILFQTIGQSIFITTPLVSKIIRLLNKIH